MFGSIGRALDGMKRAGEKMENDRLSSAMIVLSPFFFFFELQVQLESNAVYKYYIQTAELVVATAKTLYYNRL